MKVTKRKVDITTAVMVLLTGLSAMPYQLETIAVPPSVKPWLVLLGLFSTSCLLALRNQFPAVPPKPPTAP